MIGSTSTGRPRCTQWQRSWFYIGIAAEPTLYLFNKIVNDTNRTPLAAHVRKDRASDSPRIPMMDAVEIFRRDSLFEDIVRLIPSIYDSGTLCAVVGALANARSKNEEHGVINLKMVGGGVWPTRART